MKINMNFTHKIQVLNLLHIKQYKTFNVLTLFNSIYSVDEII